MYRIIEPDMVEFRYDSSVLKKSFLESGTNMLDMVIENGGGPDIDEYLRRFPFLENGGALVTDEMWRRLFAVPSRYIDSSIRMIISNAYGELSVDDINQQEAMSYRIRHDDECSPADLRSADGAIYDVLVYGALSEWFSNSGVPALVTISAGKMDAARASLLYSVKKLECVLLRQQCASPVFDDMLKIE